MTMRLTTRAALAAISLLFVPATLMAGEVAVTSKPIGPLALSSNQTRFGKLEFLGGIEMKSSDDALGAWSSIRLRPDQSHFVGVLDTGDWITGAIERDAKGVLSGVRDVAITSMRNKKGKSGNSKTEMDSEGLAFRPGQVLVSFEEKHRVDVYPDPGFATAKPIASLPKLIPDSKLRPNKSLETIVVSPAGGPLAGAPLIVAEESLNGEGNNYAAVLEGPRKGIFYVRRHAPFDVTDGAFLPDGDLVLLERSFGFLQGLQMRLHRIHAGDIKPGATVDGEELISTSGGLQIDNMEGIDAFKAADGTTHLILVSDNNHLPIQRNLMLEFRLVD